MHWSAAVLVEPAVCTSDVVSYHRIVSFRRLWLVRLERGFCACICICICVCAHAQLAAQCCQVSSRASLHSSGGFKAIGLTEFLVAFRKVGLVEARGVWHCVHEYVQDEDCVGVTNNCSRSRCCLQAGVGHAAASTALGSHPV